ISFVLYRGQTKITATPLTDRTNFVDNTTINEIYTVKVVLNGIEQTYSESANAWAQQYLTIPLQIPAGGTTPDGVSYTYSANGCSVGDLDGDGQYEIVLKWDPSNSRDNAQAGYTDSDGKAEIACKTADGTRDSTNVIIGNSDADYRNSRGYILTGPEYLTIFNGQTGKAMATVDFIPDRGNVSA
ncbi:unnamed protein product, partial [Rotaria sp. Silwood2]